MATSDAMEKKLPPPKVARSGVVAVIVRNQMLLVIRRSQLVVAPGALCFPGGAIEPGETEAIALRRELKEELQAPVDPTRCLWRSVTPWGVSLAWWSATLDGDVQLVPDPAEVQSFHWFTVPQLRASPDLLPSNMHFLDALERNEFTVDGLPVGG